MYGKMTTSRMGIIGRRFVSGFSFDVSIIYPRGHGPNPWILEGRLIQIDMERFGELGLTGLF